MAKRTTGLLDLLFKVATLLPWWLSLALAPLAYIVIHPYADMPPAGSVSSLLSKAKRQRLYQDVQRQPGKQGIEGTTWHEFELLVGVSH